jgi:hypothetical protein
MTAPHNALSPPALLSEEVDPSGPPRRPAALGDRAADDLAFIRRSMERTGVFTAISGRGLILEGLVGLAAAILAARAPSQPAWLLCWLGAAVLAFGLGTAALHGKARRAGFSLLSGIGWRFVAALAPALGAGAALTVALIGAGMGALLPGVWLLMFGAGVLTGGLFSLPLIRIMGSTFMALGLLALATPSAWGDAWMAAGFGGLNVIFGIIIARKHGG